MTLTLTGLDVDLLYKTEKRLEAAKMRRRSVVRIKVSDRERLYQLAGLPGTVKIDPEREHLKVDLADALLRSIKARVAAAEREEARRFKAEEGM